MSNFEFVGTLFSFLFPWWPFLLTIGGLRLRGRDKPKFENIIHNTLLYWVLFLIVRGGVFASGLEPLAIITLIPEPLSTILFFIIGIILIVLKTTWGNK